MKFGSILLAVLLGVFSVTATADFRDTLEFNINDVFYDYSTGSIGIDKLKSIQDEGYPSIPVYSYTFTSKSRVIGSQISCRVLQADTISIPVTVSSNKADITTSEFSWEVAKMAVLNKANNRYPDLLYSLHTQNSSDLHIHPVQIYPIQFIEESTIIFNRQIEISISDQIHRIEKGLPDLSNRSNKESGISLSSGVSATAGCPLGFEYVIVTSSALRGAFEPFLKLKLQCGFSAAIADIDSVRAFYGGVDDAEALREYLKDFYQFGGKYVLMGGDEHVVPIRYAYFYNTDTQPTLTDLMICDLYFADLNGNWDYDNDGVWGEPTHDQPDMGMELFVGRLPFSRPEQVTAYTNKLKSYLFNPGNGNFDYLNKSIFLTSDQMRDYFEGGQQYEVAGEFPDGFVTECERLAENPSGDAPSPTGPFSDNAVSDISDGYGIINVLAHGRADGFVVSSNEYNLFPKSYLLTGDENVVGDNFKDISQNNNVSFYYSISCSQATIDLETLYGQTVPSAVEELLAMENSGAVGMVAFSRWGWVGSSYKLMQSFYRHLFGSANGNPILAMQYSWLDYPYYRDQIYGQGFYGDPSLTIYTGLPSQVHIATEPAYQPGTPFNVSVSAGGSPVTEIEVTLSNGDNHLTVLTDISGIARFDVPADWNSEIEISAFAAGSVSSASTVAQSIISDADDDDPMMPLTYGLNQNYPNPFNPTTTISFSTTQYGQVSLRVFNILGELVGEPVNTSLPAGEHEAVWDSKDKNGAEVSSGIYFYRLVTEEGIRTRKMVLVK